MIYYPLFRVLNGTQIVTRDELPGKSLRGRR
jgi:hypothetical protein